MLHSICQQIWKTHEWPQDWKSSAFIPIQKEGNAKECSNYRTMALISHASKVMLKILHTRLQQYMKWEIPDVQTGFRKGRGTRDQIANIHWIIKKARDFLRNIYFWRLESPLACKEIQLVHPKRNQSWIFIGRTDAEAETPSELATWCEELIPWKRPWCWERLKAGRKGDDRGWDG